MEKNNSFLDRLDNIIHEPARLFIILNLYVLESTDFVFLMKLTGLTDGNLSAHLKRLNSAKYIHIHKEFKNNKPNTSISLSEEGRKALISYSKFMRDLFSAIPE